MNYNKQKLVKIGSTLVLLASVGSLAWSAASDAPKTPPATAAPVIGEPYKILLSRSIFSRDGKAAPEMRPASPWGHRPAVADTQPTTVPAYTAPDPEGGIVLRGVGIQDGVFTAFFEQTTEGKGYNRHIGETVARGRILAMSLDGIDYSLNGKTTRILIGQTLTGRTIDTGSATDTSAAPGGDWKSRWHHSAEAAPDAAAPAADDRGKDRKGGGSPWSRGSRSGEPRREITPGPNDQDGHGDAKPADAKPGDGPAPGGPPTDGGPRPGPATRPAEDEGLNSSDFFDPNN